MESSVVSQPRAVAKRSRAAVHPRRGALVAVLVWALLVGNAVAIVWLWYHGGNVTHVHTTGQFLTSIARITGLLGAYLALVQVLLLSRLPALERLAGFDRLTVWHRWNGHACLYLIVAHVFFSVWGYSLMDRIGIGKEISTMIWGGVYPGMIVATISTALFLLVVGTSIVIVRRRLNYQAWYAVHFTTYAAIALGWFHQVPTGNELVVSNIAADYWASLYLATLGLLLVFRLLVPVANAFRFRLRVAEVVQEGPSVVSLRITGRRLERLHAQAGQFFLWRFLARRGWWEAHPFSLSAAPDGRSLRITVKSLGDFTSRLREMAPGTRVVAEGPFGTFTAAARRRDKALLVAGGIGITPVRAMLEELDGDVIVVYRVVDEGDVIFRQELEALAAERGIDLRILAGDHTTEAGRNLLSTAHLRELVPDLADREVYVCGPPAMATAIERNVRGAGVPARYLHVERFAL
jgi:predicted ferric reductase